jgi:hypothetical protein
MAFIKIDRDMFNHWIWNEKPFSKAQAWIDLIGLANHETKDFVQNGVLVHGKRGNVYRSKLWLAERWGWSRGKVDRFLSVLEKERMIHENRVRLGTTNGTVLTIVNYGDYQKQGSTKGSTQGKPEGSSKEAQGKPEDTYKKNIKKDKKKDKENNTPLRGKYFEDPNEFLNDTKYLDDYLECESFAHEDVERAVLIRRMELGLDDPNDENVKKRRKELGLDE